jgi:hypothetical protein
VIALGATSSTIVPTIMASNGGAGTALTAIAKVGIGATLSGKSAPVRLMPHSRSGHPIAGSHEIGELVVDSRGHLWVCTQDGSPGIWHRVAYA